MKRQQWKRRAWRVFAGIGIPTGLFLLADLLFPVQANVEYTPVVLTADSSVIHTFLTADEQWRFHTEASEITPELEQAIIYKEDKYFYYHPGINVVAIGRAAINNLMKLKRTSGASTITMQVARLLKPRSRTYLNKCIEMFRALQLELHYSKREILQMYLNLVPYGSNIQGVKAAAILYFDKLPEQLSLAEITALCIIPNRPNSLMPGRDNAEIVKQRNKWLRRFQKDKVFPATQVDDALGEPLHAYRHPAPKGIPQLALRLRRMQPAMHEIYSTIHSDIQQKAEDIAANYTRALKLNNIHNLSVLVIDNRTHQVVAYLGSSDFFDKEHNGQVDGVPATRSPGSALKPALYGLCLDKGMITPKTMITDVPINFDGYQPENYDLQFRGKVSIEDALRNSLNIPAVKLLHDVGLQSFITILTNAGFSSVWKRQKKLGLSMAIGGCDVSLEELTAFYSSLANNGIYFAPEYTITGKEKQQGKKILSASACYMLSNILTELHRPDLPNLGAQSYSIPKIAWKTGTSYGRKDAWSIGYNSRYTIGVWAGNFDGTGVAGLNGAGTATPLVFQLFNAIDRHVPHDWLQQPKDIGFRFVCAQTGLLPADYCEEQLMDYCIPGVSSPAVCNHLKSVWISADDQFSYCTSCLPQAGYKTISYPNVSAELAAWYDIGHIAYEKIPPHNPACNRIFNGSAPVITSLTDNMSYIIVDRKEQQLQLMCNTSNDVKKVYWYINDSFFGCSEPGKKSFFTPSTPEVKISCADDKGRNTDIHIRIKYL